MKKEDLDRMMEQIDMKYLDEADPDNVEKFDSNKKEMIAKVAVAAVAAVAISTVAMTVTSHIGKLGSDNEGFGAAKATQSAAPTVAPTATGDTDENENPDSTKTPDESKAPVASDDADSLANPNGDASENPDESAAPDTSASTDETDDLELKEFINLFNNQTVIYDVGDLDDADTIAYSYNENVSKEEYIPIDVDYTEAQICVCKNKNGDVKKYKSSMGTFGENEDEDEDIFGSEDEIMCGFSIEYNASGEYGVEETAGELKTTEYKGVEISCTHSSDSISGTYSVCFMKDDNAYEVWSDTASNAKKLLDYILENEVPIPEEKYDSESYYNSYNTDNAEEMNAYRCMDINISEMDEADDYELWGAVDMYSTLKGSLALEEIRVNYRTKEYENDGSYSDIIVLYLMVCGEIDESTKKVNKYYNVEEDEELKENVVAERSWDFDTAIPDINDVLESYNSNGNFGQYCTNVSEEYGIPSTKYDISTKINDGNRVIYIEVTYYEGGEAEAVKLLEKLSQQ